MKKIINAHMTLLAVGVLQPASAAEVSGFLDTLFHDGGGVPSADDLDLFLADQQVAGRVVRLNPGGRAFYSLSLLGNYYLSQQMRKTRDKFRVYLLRDAHRGRFLKSREVADKELVGVSPAADTSSSVKGRAPNKLVRTAFGLRFAHGQAYWPRIPRQFSKGTGLTRHSRDTFPSLLSFDNIEQVETATQTRFILDYVGLGACIGLSPQLIWNISHQQNRYYRTFEINKKAGGKRTIDSPRLFLKVILWFLSDYVLDRLIAHEAVHSFSIGRSIVTNAKQHESKNFVGNLDIENFFGTITEDMVEELLIQRQFDKIEANIISRLCTKDGVLPQGAPTSPIISNAILYDIDDRASEICASKGLSYSRYADDITVSGSKKKLTQEALAEIASLLSKRGFLLNDSKTRIASQSGRQRVTGVVVNALASPPREFRRRARSIFHHVDATPSLHIDRVAELGGILGFLKMFPHLSESTEIRRYEIILEKLKAVNRAQ